jgi:hypothetical protein
MFVGIYLVSMRNLAPILVSHSNALDSPMSASNVIDLSSYRQQVERELSEQELADDVSARTFLFLRDEAAALGVSIPMAISEHLLGMALVVESVEGTAAAKALLAAISEKLGVMG